MKTIINNFLPVRTSNSLVSDRKFSGFLSPLFVAIIKVFLFLEVF